MAVASRGGETQLLAYEERGARSSRTRLGVSFFILAVPDRKERGMYAVVVRVSIGDRERAEQGLREQVIPMVRQAPGFVAGYWTRSESGNDGLSMILLESEDAARPAR